MSQPQDPGFTPPDDVIFEPDVPVIDTGETAVPAGASDSTRCIPGSKSRIRTCSRIRFSPRM